MDRKAQMKEMKAREGQAAKLAESPEMAEAFAELSKNPDLRREAERDPAGFLGSRGVRRSERLGRQLPAAAEARQAGPGL